MLRKHKPRYTRNVSGPLQGPAGPRRDEVGIDNRQTDGSREMKYHWRMHQKSEERRLAVRDGVGGKKNVPQSTSSTHTHTHTRVYIYIYMYIYKYIYTGIHVHTQTSSSCHCQEGHHPSSWLCFRQGCEAVSEHSSEQILQSTFVGSGVERMPKMFERLNLSHCVLLKRPAFFFLFFFSKQTLK